MTETLAPLTETSTEARDFTNLLVATVLMDPRTVTSLFTYSNPEYPSPNKHLHLLNVGGFNEVSLHIYDYYDANGSAGFMDATFTGDEEHWYNFTDGEVNYIRRNTDETLDDESIQKHKAGLGQVITAIHSGEGTVPENCIYCAQREEAT